MGAESYRVAMRSQAAAIETLARGKRQPSLFALFLLASRLDT